MGKDFSFLFVLNLDIGPYAIFEKGKRYLRKAYTRGGLRSGILGPAASWRAYTFFKMMKGFLYRGVYMGLARKCVRYF